VTGAEDARAAAAEDAVLSQHVRAVWGVPGTALGVVGWPANPSDRLFVRWNYWWQAQLLDCLVDAQHRSPSALRRRQISALTRGHRLRNAGVWTNNYHDDMAWLALSCLRAAGVGVDRRPAVTALAGALAAAADAAPGTGINWRRGDSYRNTPANGPTGLLLARLGDLPRAQALADWLHTELLDDGSGLVLDGVRDGHPPDRAVYSYCQGVVLGLETELANRTGHRRHTSRACRLTAAVAEQLAPDGVLAGCGTGDGGLFAGITARYLTVVAHHLPGRSAQSRRARATAAELVHHSARAAWDHRTERGGVPRFGTDWSDADEPPADLSVQLSAWMLLEAAATLTPRPIR